MKAWQYIALGIFAVFAWYELRPSPTQLVSVPQNPLGLATAPPNPSVGENSSVLNNAETGVGLFNNPSGLGNNLPATLQALQATRY
jgi:hypothetical protein